MPVVFFNNLLMPRSDGVMKPGEGRMITERTSCRRSALFDAAAGIVRTLKKAGHEAWFVGGSVRDLLQGFDPEEFDIVTSAVPDEVRSLFQRTVPVGERFGVVLVLEGGRSFEVATFRIDRGYEDGRRPVGVDFTGFAEEDVRRRDFTVNGLLMDPDTLRVVDVVGGQRDLEGRVIRAIGDPAERFREDHLRMLRAIRFAANLDFEIEPRTLAAIGDNAKAIGRVSAERLRDEITRMLVRGGARRGMELLAATGLLVGILPEIDALRGVGQPERFHPEGDVLEHTLRMLERLPAGREKKADPRLAWGILLHDVGKPHTRSEDAAGIHFYGHSRKGEEIAGAVMERLRFSRADRETVLSLINRHMLFMNVRNMRPNRLKRFLRMPDFDLHLELHRLDCLASHGNLDLYSFCREELAGLTGEKLRPSRLLSGHDLLDMGFQPGPLFNDIMRAVEDAQLDGLLSTPAEARRFVLERWGK
jgi:poly(A) polymerase